MNWIAIAFFGLVGAALIVWRRPIADWQGLIAGGEMRPGCAVAEGILFLILAIVVFIWRPY